MSHVLTKAFYEYGIEQAKWPTIESARVWANKQDANKVEVYDRDNKLLEEIIPSNPTPRDPGPLSP